MYIKSLVTETVGGIQQANPVFMEDNRCKTLKKVITDKFNTIIYELISNLQEQV